MFEQTFVQSQSRTRNPWTVVVSLSLQCLAIALLLVLPLLHPEALRMPQLPQPKLISTWVNLQPMVQQQASTPATTAAPARTNRIYVPIPNQPSTGAIRHIEGPGSDFEPVGTWSAGPSMSGFPLNPADATILPGRPPVQPPVAATVTKQTPVGPVQVSLGVQAAKLVYGPHPAYPRLAITARSEGVVRLAATIGTDGGIRDLRVVSGPPLLVDAALSAVRQWRYQPTLLNGNAVEVLTEVDVNFTLGR